MSNFLENNHNLINRILASIIIGSLAVAGGAWFLNNKDWSIPNPLKWVTDKAINSDPGLPKMEPVKVEMIDPNKINQGLILSPEAQKGIDQKFGKSGSTPITVGKPPQTKTEIRKR
jgi:hypothetical protein